MSEEDSESIFSEENELDSETDNGNVKKRKRKRGAGKGIASLIVIVLLVAVVYAAASLLAPAPAVAGIAYEDLTGVTETAEPMSAPSGANAAGVAVVGMDAAIDAAGSEDALPLASLTKIITALVILEEHPLEEGEEGPAITMTSEDLGYYWEVARQAGSVTDLREGEELTQRTLMERSLVVSSGNATLTLVRWAFGGRDAFLTAAQQWLQEQRLENTVVADPNGLNSDSRATAADMVRIGRIAHANPVVAELMAVESVSVMGETERNTNPLLGDEGVFAGKTGNLFASGHNLLLFTEREVHGTPVTLVTVVVGVTNAEAVRSASLSWLSQSFSRFDERVILPSGTAVGEYAPPWLDRTITVSTTAALSAIVWPGIEVPVTVLLDPVPAGSLAYTPGNATASNFGTAMSVDVEIDGFLPPPDALWRLTNPSVAITWVHDLFGSE